MELYNTTKERFRTEFSLSCYTKLITLQNLHLGKTLSTVKLHRLFSFKLQSSTSPGVRVNLQSELVSKKYIKCTS